MVGDRAAAASDFDPPTTHRPPTVAKWTPDRLPDCLHLLPPTCGLAGEGQITEQRISQAVAAAAEAPGRLRDVCRRLSALALSVAPRPAQALLQLLPDGAEESGAGPAAAAAATAACFSRDWENPLFGSAAAAPEVSAQS